MQTRTSEHFVGKCASPEMKVNAVSVFFLTCSSAEDLHHRRGEESNPVGPPLGVVDVTFPAAVWMLFQDLTATNHGRTSADMFVLPTADGLGNI